MDAGAGCEAGRRLSAIASGIPKQFWAIAMELRQGEKLTATKVVEEPRTEISESNVVTGVTKK